MLISQAMRNSNIQSSARVLGGTVVVSEKFISNCLAVFDEAMLQKADKVGLLSDLCTENSSILLLRMKSRIAHKMLSVLLIFCLSGSPQ